MTWPCFECGEPIDLRRDSVYGLYCLGHEAGIYESELIRTAIEGFWCQVAIVALMQWAAESNGWEGWSSIGEYPLQGET